MDKKIHPVVTLKNGLRVANFSSPHDFRFDDGTVLPACPPDTVAGGKLVANEQATETVVNNVRIQDIKLDFEFTDSCRAMLALLAHRHDVDIILVPLPVMQCAKREGKPGVMDEVVMPKIRVVRVADRTTKVIHSDKFCV